MKPPKITFYVPVEHLASAAYATRYALAESGFAGGFCVIARGPDTFTIKRNKAGYSVWAQ